MVDIDLEESPGRAVRSKKLQKAPGSSRKLQSTRSYLRPKHPMEKKRKSKGQLGKRMKKPVKDVVTAACITVKSARSQSATFAQKQMGIMK